MITKIYICTDKKEEIKLLKRVFHEDIFEVKLLDSFEYMYSDFIDIVNLPTSFMERLGSVPAMLDVQVIETKKRDGFARYVITSPNFTNIVDLKDEVCSIYQIESPLKKAIEFSYSKGEDLTYGVFSEYVFAYIKDKNYKTLGDAKYYITSILSKNNILLN